MDFDSLKDDSETKNSSSHPVMFDDLKPDTKPLMFDELKDDNEKSNISSPQISTGISGTAHFIPPNSPASQDPETMRQIGSALEGAAQGFAGPLATAAELGLNKIGVPGFSPQEIKKRREDYPGTFGGGEALGIGAGLYTGVGEAGLLAKMFGGAEGATWLTRIGSGALKNGIQAGLIQGGDEISKSLLGQADPETPVSTALAHIGASSLFGGALGTIFSSAGEMTNLAKTKNLPKMVNDWAAGFGTKSMPNAQEIELMETPMGVDPKMYKAGQKFYDDIVNGDIGKGFKTNMIRTAGRTAAPIIGAIVGGNPVAGSLAASGLEYGVEKALEAGIPVAARKYAGPALYRMSSEGQLEHGIEDVLNYCSSIARGESAISKGVQSLFGGPVIVDTYDYSKKRDSLKKIMEEGGIDSQITGEIKNQDHTHMYAEGGHVQSEKTNEPNSIAKYFPEHNVLLNAAKSRISNYLNSVRPISTASTLPYDKIHKDKIKERQYDKTLDLANNPLSVLKHIKNGTLLPKQVHDFRSMYPELYNNLSKKITETIMQGKLKDEKMPPYKTRQAMSLFLGSNLDSTLTPQNIMAAQAVFVQQKAQKSIAASKTNNLVKDSKEYQTAEQARQDRAND